MRRWLAAVMILLVIGISVTPATAATNRISRIDIAVSLAENGTATVTETWEAEVYQGTEVYLVKDNLARNQIKISELKVSDDTGRNYETVPSWEPSASFEQKAYLAGYHRVGSQVELCFGISQYGKRTYTISYQMTNFAVRYADEVSGFYVRVVNYEMSAPPEKVTVKIAIPGKSLISTETRVWAFGFEGQILVQDGLILANSLKPLVKKSHITIAAGLAADTLSPEFSSPQTFDQILDTAKSGSDYDSDTEGFDWASWLVNYAILPSIPVIYLFSLFRGRDSYATVLKMSNRFDKLITKRQSGYFRQLPLGGDLPAIQHVISSEVADVGPSGLIGGFFLKWLFEKRIEISALSGGKDLKKKTNLQLVFLPERAPTESVEAGLWEIASLAAGKDLHLSSHELSNWSDSNASRLNKWFKAAKKTGKGSLSVNSSAALDEILGFRHFLQDFTIINERAPLEVALWGEYLVVANLVGLAEQVARDFEQLYPGYLANHFDSLGTPDSFGLFTRIGYGADQGLARHYAEINRDSGDGGWSSSGGGSSGFSGGGSGGGFR